MVAPEVEISGKKGEAAAFANAAVTGTEVVNDSIRFGSAHHSLAGVKFYGVMSLSTSSCDKIKKRQNHERETNMTYFADH